MGRYYIRHFVNSSMVCELLVNNNLGNDYEYFLCPGIYPKAKDIIVNKTKPLGSCVSHIVSNI